MQHSFVPEKISTVAIVTIVGGTVGGYITFSGAHRLLDAGISGKENILRIDRSAMSGILISTLMRFILFLAVVGVVYERCGIDKDNPAATVFKTAAGEVGLRIFGIVLWSAAISSVLGAAYTSVSFFKTFHPLFRKYEKFCISLFIIHVNLHVCFSWKTKTIVDTCRRHQWFDTSAGIGNYPDRCVKTELMKGYHHPVWMQVAGWIVVMAMGWMGWLAVTETLHKWQ